MIAFLVIGAMTAFVAGLMMLASRRASRRVDAILPAVRAYASSRGHRFAEPGRTFRTGLNQTWEAVAGDARGLPFTVTYSWSRQASAPYITVQAVPTWLQMGHGFDIARFRRPQSQWQQSGLWVAGGPESVAEVLRGPLAPAIAELASIPRFEMVNAVNAEVPGARLLHCWIVCDVWKTDAGELDRLVELLATLCKGR